MKIDFTHPELPMKVPKHSVVRNRTEPETTPLIPHPSRRRRRFFRFSRVFFYATIALIGTGLTFSYQTLLSAERSIVEKEDKTPVFQQLRYLMSVEDKPLIGEAQDRINLLLYGMGGEGHSSGIYLTDTIILLSLKPSTQEAAMLSIPRDLVVAIPGTQEYRKINTLNYIGMERKSPGGGEEFATQAIASMLGTEIPYFVRVDFSAFREIIDIVDGITVDVDQAFTDYTFPDYNFGFQTVSFSAGPQVMDGETALQYSRSRHGSNQEGSDFARSRRQQKVLTGLKEKIFSAGTLTHPSKMSQILSSFGKHVATNLELWEMVRLSSLASDFSSASISNQVLDSGTDSPLHSEISDETGAYVLVPDAGLGNYEEVRTVVRSMFDELPVANEEALIEVQNGTTHPGWAAETAQDLRQEQYRVIKVGNATVRDYTKSVIYDLSAGSKPETVTSLKAKYHANVSTIIPSFIEASEAGEVTLKDLEEDFEKQSDSSFESFEKRADLVLILGEETWKEQQSAPSTLPVIE